MVVSRVALAPTEEPAGGRLSDEVELYQRTYNTLLRSSGETALRVLESSHRAMGSSLHPLAASDEPDLGAFIYAIRRLPDGIVGARPRDHGPGVGGLRPQRHPDRASGRRPTPPRAGGAGTTAATGTLAVLLASASDVDDLIPTLVAFQIEWNKLRVRQRAAGWPPERRADAGGVRPGAGRLARRLGAPARGLGRALRRAAAA